MSKFQGILAVINEPSTMPAGGSGGLKVVITRRAAQNIVAQAQGAYLSHDHVNFMPSMHPGSMIGHIEEAVIVGNAIVISGEVNDEWVDKHGNIKFGLSMEVRTASEPFWYDNELRVNRVNLFAGAAVVEKPAFGQSTFEVLK